MWIDKLAENKSFIYIGRQLVTGMKMIGIVIYGLLGHCKTQTEDELGWGSGGGGSGTCIAVKC